MLGAAAPIVGNVVHEMAKNGSPALLSTVGRIAGLGVDDQQALVQGRIPFWFWIVVGVGTGAALHAYWPNIKSFVSKEK